MDTDVHQLKFEIWPPGHPNTAAVRKTFAERMSRLYLGWDDGFDSQFDRHSYLFVLWDGVATYHATCRLIFKWLGDASILTPCETADGSRYGLPDRDRTCEGSMVSMTSVAALRRLMYGVCSWLMKNEVTRLYTTYDIDNALIRRFYTRTLGFDDIPDAVIVYRDFVHRDSLEPVAWQMVAGNPVRTGPTTLANLLKAGGALCHVPADAPMLPKATSALVDRNREIVRPVAEGGRQPCPTEVSA